MNLRTLIQDILETFIQETPTLEVSQNQESTEITGIIPRTIYVILESMTDIAEEIHVILDMITLTEIKISDINLEHLPSVHTNKRPGLDSRNLCQTINRGKYQTDKHTSRCL